MSLQYARPDSDIRINNWGTSTGTSYFALINEATADDSDYVECVENDGAEGQPFEVGLSDIEAPVTNEGVKLCARMRANVGSTANVSVRLYQGDTLIFSKLFESETPSRESSHETVFESATDFSLQQVFVPPSSVQNITDYTDLRLRFIVTSLVGGDSVEISQAYVEFPPARSTNEIFRPDSTIAANSWVVYGSGSTLHGAVGALDGAYANANAVNTTMELGLPSITDPSTSTGHVVSVIFGGDVGNTASQTLSAYLYQGATLIATVFSGLYLAESRSNATLAVNYELTASEANSITDYTALELHFTTSGLGSGQEYYIDSAYLCLPGNFLKVFRDESISFTETVYSATPALSLPASITASANLISFSESVLAASGSLPVEVSTNLINFTEGVYSATAPVRVNAGLVIYTETVYGAAASLGNVVVPANLISFTETVYSASVSYPVKVSASLVSFSETVLTATGLTNVKTQTNLISFSESVLPAIGKYPLEYQAPLLTYSFRIFKHAVFQTQTSFNVEDDENFDPNLMNRTTRLEAINTMLSCIGESPINSLVNVTAADALVAISILNEISREVQSQGWAFNTDYDLPLVPNEDSQIVLSNDVVRVDLQDCDYPNYNVQIRGNRLYERNNRTFEFDKTIKATVIKLFRFEDLPEVAARYITIRAARTFANRYLGAREINVYTQEEEFKARSVLMDAEAVDDDINMLSNSPYTRFRTFQPRDSIIRRW